MQKWMVLAKKADFYGIGRKFGVDPVIARVIRNRERISEEEIEQYLHGGMNQIYSFRQMKGMEEALELLLEKIREKKNTPIIMLTAKGEDMDKILGLEYGADDYITKPFNILEVKARIKAILRRTRAAKKNVEENVIVNGDVRLDKDNRRVQICGREINLTGKEFELLEFLVANPGKVYGRAKLLQLIWGKDYPGDERTVDVHVRRLREKIEPNPSEPRYVQTKWGVGYYYQGTSI